MSTLNRNSNLFFPALNNTGEMQLIMRRVFIWMGLGTLLTSVVAYFTVNTALINLAMNPVALLITILAELALVLGLSFGLNRMSSGVAVALFFAYAALNGFTISLVLLAFSIGTVVSAFAATAVLFGVMAVIGYTTKTDLTRMGTYLMMGVIGLVIAMVINLFINSGPLDLLISMIGVLIFTGLTAYDTQRIAQMAAQIATDDDGAARVSVFGALRLYLDFINMFLFMLRLMGGRRR
ncbi:Bax inhibitor-1/YccA family protein [Geitlerinema splendidum]|jgi:FtsH-binding integral membrane protein|nr:Bax inhibitor-1/YccA family protein [Geitlerinema splendidum]